MPLHRLVLGVAIAAVIGGCGEPPMATPSPSLAPISSLTPSACIDQNDWEPHEGAFTGHWEAAGRAITSHDGATGGSEARLAASEIRAMADLAAVPDPNVARLLRGAASALDVVATAFGIGDFATAKAGLSDAQDQHELALGSTSRKDWCT